MTDSPAPGKTSAVSALLLTGLIAVILSPPNIARGQPTEADWFVGAINTPRNLTPPRNGEPLLIAIVDDGVRGSHESVRDFIWQNPAEIPYNGSDDDGNGFVDDVFGWDVSDGDNDPTPPVDRDEFYHGTHVAGIVTLLARQAYGDRASDYIRILPVKTLADNAPDTRLIDAFEGIRYAIDAGADIILCAWGVALISGEEASLLRRAANAGILVIGSAGNLPQELEQYPAAHDSVLAVGSLDRDGSASSNSNFGRFIDLLAPGQQIHGASNASDDAYLARDGSSFAAAMAAAGAAFIKLQHPDYSNPEIIACLKSSSDPVPLPGRRFSAKLGAGSLNLAAAIDCELLQQVTQSEQSLQHPEGFLRARGSGRESYSWHIQPAGEFDGLDFRPVFNREARAEGRLEFRGSAGGELLASYELAALPPRFHVPGLEAHVTFVSESRRRFDWMLEYEAQPINFRERYCRGIMELETEGTISDGSGANSYAANSDCKWLITAPAGQIVRFHFEQLDTEANTDTLYFFNGNATNADIIATYSGPSIPAEYRQLDSWSNQVLVWFLSNDEDERQGWRLRYTFEDP